MRTQVFLVVAGKLAGLHTDNHDCTWVTGRGEARNMADLLRAFPVDVTEEVHWGGPGFAIRGLPANFIIKLLNAMRNPTWGSLTRRSRDVSECKVKKVVVPAEDTYVWTQAMISSVYGPHAVTNCTAYLGVTVAGHDPENLGLATGTFSKLALELITEGTWKSTVKLIQEREGPLTSGIAASVGLRSGQWNGYLISTLGYGPQLAAPSNATLRALGVANDKFFPTGTWAKANSTSMLGPFCRIPGVPKCPKAAIDACSLASYLRGALWAPRSSFRISRTSVKGASGGRGTQSAKGPPSPRSSLGPTWEREPPRKSSSSAKTRMSPTP
eukprot:4567148-Heterocapsa_arctica.AAC.2